MSKSDEKRLAVTMKDDPLYKFIKESNMIEGIHSVSADDIRAHTRLIKRDEITIYDLQDFVSKIQPGALLRDKPGLNVRVRSYSPPSGNPEIKDEIKFLLSGLKLLPPYNFHTRYEKLHPFTDGNGRSGRALWLWQRLKRYEDYPKLGFLHTWYYQSLDGGRT